MVLMDTIFHNVFLNFYLLSFVVLKLLVFIEPTKNKVKGVFKS